MGGGGRAGEGGGARKGGLRGSRCKMPVWCGGQAACLHKWKRDGGGGGGEAKGNPNTVTDHSV